MDEYKKIIETTASAILNLLAKTFPVACSSDEFYYFPHITTDQPPEIPWDDFSPESINTVLQSLTIASSDLENLEIPSQERDVQTDRNVLVHFLQTLQDYLKNHLVWKRQPSFYLTIMNIGIVNSIHSGDQEVISRRMKMLPGFLEQGVKNLEDIPAPWMEIGLSMIADCKELIISLPGKLPGTESSLKAIDHLGSVIEKRVASEAYSMPEELLKKIYSRHLATGLTLSEITAAIRDEIDEMWEIMVGEAGRILKEPITLSHHPGRLIELVYQRLQSPERSQDHLLLLLCLIYFQTDRLFLHIPFHLNLKYYLNY